MLALIVIPILLLFLFNSNHHHELNNLKYVYLSPDTICCFDLNDFCNILQYFDKVLLLSINHCSSNQ